MKVLRNRAYAHEREVTLNAIVAAVAWLWRRDDELAKQMRDEFCREWEVGFEEWNEEADAQIDFASRNGGPGAMEPFEAVLI